MAEHAYKTPGLIRAGFHYQDLVAIETLIDFYRDSERYRWVEIDSRDDAFQSVEDIVACLPDGRFDLTQVKFTADPSATANSLSWDWLTERRKRGRSLLQKWSATTLKQSRAGNLRRALLRTDRKPDAAVLACLDGPFVRYDRIPTEVRAVVDDHIGSEADARAFFSAFEFVHSCPLIEDLETQLRTRLASDTDSGGWAQFRLAVQTWGTLKNQPGPDGRIRHIHLRQAFSLERARPLPQGFEVPKAYSVPDAGFDKAFRAEIVESDGVSVLWGPPGRGKSTYLSHCVDRIDPRAAVCIRHHYFLSLDDRSEGRFHYQAIARSFEHQLEQERSDLIGARQSLGELIETAAGRLAAEGRRLIVFVDGLDHVWRENRNHEEMEEVFNALLPLPPNVRLVVGTQKIASEHLPARLLRAVPPEDWRALPLMSPSAVAAWLKRQNKAGRLNLEIPAHRTPAEALAGVARAFHKVSGGLPLHLIYSFEAIARSGQPVNADAVAALPACPTGDIRDYYRAIWKRLSPKAQTLLHVLAGLSFGPPPSAMGACFGKGADALAAEASINHLLDYREIEVRPFHGSLYAFIRDLPGHDTAFQTHATAVRTWLETEAPAWWRWAWLWITKAQLGEPDDLLHGPDRAWAIEGLCAGFPIDQLATILERAESLSFAALDLPRTLELRSLKTRALNGPEFQAYEVWAQLTETAVSMSGDPATTALLRAGLKQAEPTLFPYMVRGADASIRPALAEAAIRQLNHRMTNRDDEGIVRSDHGQVLARAAVEVVANMTPRDARRAVDFARRSAVSDGLIELYGREALAAGKPENVLSAGVQFTGRYADRQVFAALCLEGLSPSMRPALQGRSHPAIRCLAVIKGDKPARSRVRRDLARLFDDEIELKYGTDGRARAALYDVFFSALAEGLKGRSAVGWAQIPAASTTTWLAGAFRAAERLARDIAQGWRAGCGMPALGDIHERFVHPPRHGLSHGERRPFIDVRLALQDIAVDLCLLRRAVDPAAFVTADDLTAARSSPYWLDMLWLEAFCERRLRLHAPEAVRVFVEARIGALDAEVSQFDERTAEATRLALFAHDHGVDDLARTALRHAMDGLIGYGYRKDPFAFEVLESLEMIGAVDPTLTRAALLRLAGAYERITDYTDGDETDHAREEYYELLAKFAPDRIPACYASLVRTEDWRYAEALTTTLAASPELETPAGQALLETFLDRRERAALRDIAGPVRPMAEAAWRTVHIQTGVDALGAEAGEETASVSDPAEVEECQAPLPSPGDYPPDRLASYLGALGKLTDYEVRREQTAEWLRHWDRAGQAETALESFRAEVAANRLRFDIESALDVAFEISHRTEGRTKAFFWLVRSQVLRYGWQRWFTSRKEGEGRLRLAARHYPDRWRDFIRQSSESVLSLRVEREGAVIGISRLVFFLLEVGQTDLAKAYVSTMVDILEAEVCGQPIRTPEWAR